MLAESDEKLAAQKAAEKKARQLAQLPEDAFRINGSIFYKGAVLAMTLSEKSLKPRGSKLTTQTKRAQKLWRVERSESFMIYRMVRFVQYDKINISMTKLTFETGENLSPVYRNRRI
ncbi:MAG: hypothetical protein M5U34_03810 [Chloroflexi bacterium]|nr:hypothetical protein [Chloroflexota bacterium]